GRGGGRGWLAEVGWLGRWRGGKDPARGMTVTPARQRRPNSLSRTQPSSVLLFCCGGGERPPIAAGGIGPAPGGATPAGVTGLVCGTPAGGEIGVARGGTPAPGKTAGKGPPAEAQPKARQARARNPSSGQLHSPRQTT